MLDMSFLALGQAHNVSTIRSTPRDRSMKSIETTHLNEPGTVARCELDSHANTCFAGPNINP
jgi:hypothetical protein